MFGRTVADRLAASIEGNIEEIIPHSDGQAFLAIVDGEIVGSIVMAERKNIAYFWGMYISRSYRRQGIGRQLIAHAAERIKAAEKVQVCVLTKRESAQKFYDSLGFSGEEKSWMDFVKDFQVEVFTKSISVKKLKKALS